MVQLHGLINRAIRPDVNQYGSAQTMLLLKTILAISTSQYQDEIHAFVTNHKKENTMGTVLLIVLILVLIGAVPAWPHSRSWGYGPSGVVGLIVVVLIIMLLMGRI